jgi:seryl-tRNA synthetase
MIDLKRLREDSDWYRRGAARKHTEVPIDRVLELDAARREAMSRQESLQAQQNKLAKETARRSVR